LGRRTGCPPVGCAPTQKTRPPKFVVNVRDAAWETNDQLGAMCAFEGESAPFADLGINLRVLQPGGKGLYHAEPTQEDFLVLAGESLLLVEGEERPLTAWDFAHCPPGTSTRSLLLQIFRASSSWRAHRARHPQPPSPIRGPSSPSGIE
jgi:glyoxylate utilization-related uncharacterized protein